VVTITSVLASVFALALLLATAAPEPASAQTVDLEELSSFVERARADWEVPGVAVGIIHGDSVLLARGFGVRDLETGEAVDEETIFAIGATSKAFTSPTLGILVDEGRLEWDDRAVEHLPGFRLRDPYVTGAITVRDLLSHTSGLPRGDQLWYGSEYDRDEILRRVRNLEPGWGFRQRYGYQNIMFLAAGEVVRNLSGQSWDDFVEGRIFRPLSMDRTTTSTLPLSGMANVATPHARVDGEVRGVAWRNLDNVAPAGSINSSASEMLHWLRLHLNGGKLDGLRILSEEALEEIFTPNSVVRRSSEQRELFPETHLQSYGLAWSLRDYRGHGVIGHGGAIDGMRAEVALVPELELGVVVLSNLGGGSYPTAIIYGVLDRFIGPREKDWSETLLERELEGRERAEARRQKVEDARIAGTSPSLPVDAYAGRYDQDFHGLLEVEASGSDLVVRRGPGLVGDLEHWHHDTFQVRWRDAVMGRSFVVFTVGPEGTVRSVELEQFGRFAPVEEDTP
jgi:CubicO group peptidase (beta-lactamase class C family)